jgi:hypothetical protein
MYIKNRYTSYNLEKDEHITVHPFEECLMAMQKRYKDAEAAIENLEKENKALKDEHYKDGELQRIQEELTSLKRARYRGFPISEEEQEKIKEWQKEHDKEVHGVTDIKGRLTKAGAIGGDYTYEFIPTSIGTFGSIKCTCGAKFEFQEV